MPTTLQKYLPRRKTWRLPVLIVILVIGLALSTFFALSGKFSGWWNNDWTKRQKLTLNLGAAAITDPVGTTPVLVRLHDGNFSFDAARDDGSDLRFVAADNKTELPYQIEKYDPLMGEAFVWVQVPNLKPGTPTDFWVYYDNGHATPVSDAKRPYDADTVLVYHFGEHGQPPADASGSGNNGDKAGVPATGSIIGDGLRLNDQDIITIPASSTLQWVSGGTATWSAWVKPAALQPNAIIFSRRDGGGDFLVGLDSGVPFVEVNGQRSSAGSPIAINSWHHLAVVTESGKTTLYLDGASYGSLGAGLPGLNAPSEIGGDTAGGTGFTGDIDELEISRVARSAAWIKFAALTQNGDATSTILTVNRSEATKGGGGSNLYVTILENVTIDGWIVIAILAVLGGVSAKVAADKWKYLKENSAANARFIEAWHEVASDLTVLDHGNAEKIKTLGGRVGDSEVEGFKNSSIYRLYHIGSLEVSHRLAAFQNGAAKVLSAQSTQAIRASLDTGLVAENEKFNRHLNVLTNAISGGPFIGLAGTVAGVTVTFASIARAGEVNISQIAPGVSAALVTTLAGLFVAIPATFVYNSISSQIEAATGQLQVFIDEYVAKLAEFYSPRGSVRTRHGGATDVDQLLDGLSELLTAARARAHEPQAPTR